MALRCLVKISSVNNLSDARYAAGMGVELMGFNMDPNAEDFISPEQFNAITSWISGVKFVGELDDCQGTDLGQLPEQYGIDYLQIDAGVDPAILKVSPLPLIIKIARPSRSLIADSFKKFSELPAWYLLEPEKPLSEELLAWCKTQTSAYPIMLGSNLSTDNVDSLIAAGFSGFSLKGGEEIRPGFKNFDELADILETLETED